MSFSKSGSRGSTTPSPECRPGRVGWWLAIRDLFFPLGGLRCVSTGVVILLLALALMVVLASLGEIEIQKALRDRKRAALPGHLWDEEQAGRPRRFTPQRVEELKKGLDAALPGAGVRCVPFYSWEYEWVCGEKLRGGRRLAGRSADLSDPIWTRLKDRITYRSGMEGKEGVVFTAAALESLGYDARQPPQEAEVLPMRGKARKVVVLGVLSEPEFPPRTSFAMTTGAWESLELDDYDVSLPLVRVGPLRDDFPEAADLPEKLRVELGQSFREYGLRWPVIVEPEKVNKGESRYWKLEHVNRDGEPYRWSVWVALVDNLRDQMAKARLQGADAFRLTSPPEGVRKRQRPAHDRVGVWVPGPDRLRDAATAARSTGISLDEDPIRVLEDLTAELNLVEQRAVSNRVLLAVAYAVGLGLVYGLRVFNQFRHLALLQAIGVSRWTLVTFYLYQAGVIWLIGVVLGTALAVARLAPALGMTGLATLWQEWWGVIVVGGLSSLAITTLSLLVCALPALLWSPMRVLTRPNRL